MVYSSMGNTSDPTEPPLRISGTQIADLLGIGWGSPSKVYLKNRMRVEFPDDDDENKRSGRDLEDYCVKRFVELKGTLLTKLPDKHPSPKHEFMCGSIDRLIVGPYIDSPYEEGVEAKTSIKLREWGRQGTAEIPPTYFVQSQWYNELYELKRVWVPALVAHRFRLYEVPRDQSIIDGLLEVAERFWRVNLVGGEPPPVDASEEYAALTRKLWKRSNGELRDATVEEEILMSALVDAQIAEKCAKTTIEFLKNKLRHSIGEGDGLTSKERGKVYNRTSKAGVRSLKLYLKG